VLLLSSSDVSPNYVYLHLILFKINFVFVERFFSGFWCWSLYRLDVFSESVSGNIQDAYYSTNADAFVEHVDNHFVVAFIELALFRVLDKLTTT
jgi:hypothetical protein